MGVPPAGICPDAEGRQGIRPDAIGRQGSGCSGVPCYAPAPRPCASLTRKLISIGVSPTLNY